MNKSSLSFCPVPQEQQPVNEYEQLKESWFFRWATLDKITYIKKFLWVWFWGSIPVAPIAASSFPPGEKPLLFALSVALGASFLVVLVLLRLYSGWYYIRDRLQAQKVFYEESGWYDGQTWQKPPQVWQRDQLIVSYQVQPIMHRLQKTAMLIGSWLILGTFLWLWL